jgi:hypothetical protein
VEARQGVGQQAVAQGRRRPEAHPATAQARHLVHRALGALDVDQDALRVREQGLAGTRQLDRATVADEQRRAEGVLQDADLLGQRRLGDAGQLGGAGEVAGSGHRDEIAQLLDLHDPILP